MSLKSINDLIKIAAAGGGMELEVSLKSTDDLIRIAAAAAVHKSPLVLTGLEMRSVNDLIRIAAAGKGAVHFKGI